MATDTLTPFGIEFTTPDIELNVNTDKVIVRLPRSNPGRPVPNNIDIVEASIRLDGFSMEFDPALARTVNDGPVGSGLYIPQGCSTTMSVTALGQDVIDLKWFDGFLFVGTDLKGRSALIINSILSAGSTLLDNIGSAWLHDVAKLSLLSGSGKMSIRHNARFDLSEVILEGGLRNLNGGSIEITLDPGGSEIPAPSFNVVPEAAWTIGNVAFITRDYIDSGSELREHLSVYFRDDECFSDPLEEFSMVSGNRTYMDLSISATKTEIFIETNDVANIGSTIALVQDNVTIAEIIIDDLGQPTNPTTRQIQIGSGKPEIISEISGCIKLPTLQLAAKNGRFPSEDLTAGTVFDFFLMDGLGTGDVTTGGNILLDTVSPVRIIKSRAGKAIVSDGGFDGQAIFIAISGTSKIRLFFKRGMDGDVTITIPTVLAGDLTTTLIDNLDISRECVLPNCPINEERPTVHGLLVIARAVNRHMIDMAISSEYTILGPIPPKLPTKVGLSNGDALSTLLHDVPGPIVGKSTYHPSGALFSATVSGQILTVCKATTDGRQATNIALNFDLVVLDMISDGTDVYIILHEIGIDNIRLMRISENLEIKDEGVVAQSMLDVADVTVGCWNSCKVLIIAGAQHIDQEINLFRAFFDPINSEIIHEDQGVRVFGCFATQVIQHKADELMQVFGDDLQPTKIFIERHAADESSDLIQIDLDKILLPDENVMIIDDPLFDGRLLWLSVRTSIGRSIIITVDTKDFSASSDHIIINASTVLAMSRPIGDIDGIMALVRSDVGELRLLLITAGLLLENGDLVRPQLSTEEGIVALFEIDRLLLTAVEISVLARMEFNIWMSHNNQAAESFIHFFYDLKSKPLCERITKHAISSVCPGLTSGTGTGLDITAQGG